MTKMKRERKERGGGDELHIQHQGKGDQMRTTLQTNFDNKLPYCFCFKISFDIFWEII